MTDAGATANHPRRVCLLRRPNGGCLSLCDQASRRLSRRLSKIEESGTSDRVVEKERSRNGSTMKAIAARSNSPSRRLASAQACRAPPVRRSLLFRGLASGPRPPRLIFKRAMEFRLSESARHRGDLRAEQAEGGSTFCGRLPLCSLPSFRVSQFQLSVLENSVSLGHLHESGGFR